MRAASIAFAQVDDGADRSSDSNGGAMWAWSWGLHDTLDGPGLNSSRRPSALLWVAPDSLDDSVRLSSHERLDGRPRHADVPDSYDSISGKVYHDGGLLQMVVGPRPKAPQRMFRSTAADLHPETCLNQSLCATCPRSRGVDVLHVGSHPGPRERTPPGLSCRVRSQGTVRALGR